jgi:protein-S-isoprenylcysteine O-methyltransferase Ste14
MEGNVLETAIAISAWIIVGFIGLLAITILVKIWRNEIDLSKLLCEDKSDKASLSRFQFLIFTFVIALSYFWVILMKQGFPDEIPTGVYALLGISGGSYVVSKGISGQKKLE